MREESPSSSSPLAKFHPYILTTYNTLHPGVSSRNKILCNTSSSTPLEQCSLRCAKVGSLAAQVDFSHHCLLTIVTIHNSSILIGVLALTSFGVEFAILPSSR